MAHNTIKIELDSTHLQKVIDKLSGHLPDATREFVDRLVDLSQVPGEFTRIESHTTAGAIKVTLHPSDRLLELLATPGAWRPVFQYIMFAEHNTVFFLKRSLP